MLFSKYRKKCWNFFNTLFIISGTNNFYFFSPNFKLPDLFY